MKYWVYKESRILGPFDKEAVAVFPGIDSGTLVCAGDPSGGSWIPAGELEGLTGISAVAASVIDEFPSSVSLLDQLQIDSAGLVDDGDFPGSFADELFQDATLKKSFGDVLSARSPADEAEASRARDKISELTAKLVEMQFRISELEASQKLELRSRAKEPEAAKEVVPSPDPSLKAEVREIPPPAPELPTLFVAEAPAPIAAPEARPLFAAAPLAAPPPIEWTETPAAGVPLFELPAAVAPVQSPEQASEARALPDIPSFSDAPPASKTPLLTVEPAEIPPELSEADPPAPTGFGKPKTFRIVPTVKSFKVLGADEAAPVSSNSVPVFNISSPVAEFSPFPAESPAAAANVPEVAIEPTPAPVPVPAPAVSSFGFPALAEVAISTPSFPPPNTLSQSQPVTDLTFGDLAGSVPAGQDSSSPYDQAGFVEEVVGDAVAARFAKPDIQTTSEVKRPRRNNKAFLVGGGALVVMLMVLGVILMRQPKDDLKQMTTLDDGKAPIGLSQPDDGAVAPPQPPPAIVPVAAPALPAGPSAEHSAAIAEVKNFPLDGGRGTVGRWLQYSYTADPNAGSEKWNASATGVKTMLVEYRLIPGAAGGKSALYLFEVDSNGIVAGKNLDARQMLAGGPPLEVMKPKKKQVAIKRAPRRRFVVAEPKEVPLLPLPDSGELRPPAEDDGVFGSDTVNSPN